MLLFCVRVSCQDKVLYGPKWISIEETSTLCDVLRCATGDKYLTRKLKVVVASEKSLKDLSFVKLGLPVVILDKNDKKVVSFLLKPLPDNAVITAPAPERKLSIQSTQQLNSDEDDRHSVTPDQEHLMYHGIHSPHSPHSQFHPPYPHYPYMAPMYHHPPHVMCHCPSCTGHRPPVHSPHGSAPGSFVHHQMAPHPSWTMHGSPTAFQVRPRLQRPMSAPTEKLEMIVKGSPLYGQPPWWGWGSSDDEIYNYPNTATILDEGDRQAGQQALSLKKKKITKKDALEMAQRRHSIGTVSVLSESKARIVTTRTSNTTYNPEQERATKQREEFVVYQKKSSLPSPGYSEQLSPVFENSTSRDWEMPCSHNEQAERESSSSTENSPEDGSEGHSRLGSSYEIPYIPKYDEVPERPVSLKSDKGKAVPQDGARKGSAEKQDRVVTRKKPTSKIKKKVLTSDAAAKNGKLPSNSRKHSSDTSESEYEPSSHPSRRSGVVAMGTPSSAGVFGLTEVTIGDENRRETLSPAPLPSWVQQWANNTDNRGGPVVQPIEVLGSSSAGEDSTASNMMSSPSQIPVPVETESSENKTKPVNNVSSPSLNRPRSASSRTPSIMRSQSLNAANLSSSQKSSSSPRVARSKTMSAAVRRSYPAAGSSESDKKTTDSVRRRGTVSSTSDDSDVESSDTSGSQSKQTRESRRRSDESDRRGVQLIPEREGKRPLSAPRPNKTAMLRAHNSREAVKNSGVKKQSPVSAKARTTKSSPPSVGAVSQTNDNARVWSPSTKRSTKSSTGDDNREAGENGGEDVCSSPVDDVTQEAVDDVFTSGPVRPLPESLQMKRDDNVNKTFVLDEGNADVSVSSPEEDSMQAWKDKVSNTENGLESKDDQDKTTIPTSPSSTDSKGIKLEATNTRGISLRSKLIPFAPFMGTQSYTPPVSDQPFEPPSDSADDTSGGSRSSTAEGRPMSPDSVVSMTTAASPSPPLTPSSAARKVFDFKGAAASSQSRRQWGVTDKPVEDLMLSSIHAFSVELRLASESVLGKVKSLYDGSEELNGTTRSRTDSDSKQESQSAIPDWKSSHAEIAGIFRNLRKVELRLRTMEQALSIMCVAAQREPNQPFQDRKLSMVETSSLVSGQKWREFKIKARRNSWAVEHRNQFPVPPAESDEDDEDTS